MKASDAASNEQMQHIIVIMLAENWQFVFTGSSNIIETIKNTNKLLSMKGILLEKKQTGVIFSPSHLLNYALLPCPSFSPAWNGAGRYDLANTNQVDDQHLQTDDQAVQPENQALQPDHQEYPENQPDM